MASIWPLPFWATLTLTALAFVAFVALVVTRIAHERGMTWWEFHRDTWEGKLALAFKVLVVANFIAIGLATHYAHQVNDVTVQNRVLAKQGKHLGVQNSVLLSKIQHEAHQRIAATCRYAYNEKLGQREDAIDDFKRLPGFLKFFNGDPQELVATAAKQAREHLHGRYGNGRLPRYCPQRKRPENEKGWPPALRSK